MAASWKMFGLAVGLAAFCQGATAAESQFDLAAGLVEAGRYGQALDALKAVEPASASDTARVDLLIGRVYLGLGKPAKALDLFEKAAFGSLDAEAEAYLGLAEAELAMGDLARARRHAALALKSDGDLVAAHLVQARADLRVGQTEAAAQRLRQLRRDRPDSEDAAVIHARFLAQTSGPESGLAELDRFARAHPSAAAARDALGQMLWGMGRKSEAIAARRAAMALYEERGQSGRAEALAQWLAEVDPDPQPLPEPIPQPAAPVPPPAAAAPAPQPEAKSDQPPPPQAQPRAKVEAAVIEAPRVTKAMALPQPEALPFKPGSPIMTGSGVVLEGGRQIITNRHVIEGMTAIAVRNGAGHVRKARVVKTSREDDLALLEIDKPFPDGSETPYSQIVEPAPGRAAIVMGYPLISVLGDEQPALTEGIVAKSTGLANDPNTFQITAKINKGNSGGPIFDRRGRLLGVAVGKMDSAAIAQSSGNSVEDINLGIKGGRILGFLGKSAATETAASASDLGLEELYQMMLPRAVLVAAQK